MVALRIIISTRVSKSYRIRSQQPKVLRQDHSHSAIAAITVAILGGDPVVGRTLELMLKSDGYNARFLNGSFIDKPAELPEEVRLVILAPGLHHKGRERFLNRMEDAPAAKKVPILELVRASERERAEQLGYVLWPCPANDLKQGIEAVLRAASHVG
jgi:hypothetical protein